MALRTTPVHYHDRVRRQTRRAKERLGAASAEEREERRRQPRINATARVSSGRRRSNRQTRLRWAPAHRTAHNRTVGRALRGGTAVKETAQGSRLAIIHRGLGKPHPMNTHTPRKGRNKGQFETDAAFHFLSDPGGLSTSMRSVQAIGVRAMIGALARAHTAGSNNQVNKNVHEPPRRTGSGMDQSMEGRIAIQ